MNALCYLLGLPGFALLAASPAHAREAPVPGETAPVEIELTMAAASDYRFRGVSLTNQKPALQVELSAAHETGLYVAFFGSNVASNGGAGLEADFGIGYAVQAGPIAIEISAMHYMYPGSGQDNYTELSGRLSTNAGPLELGLTAAYAPPQDALGRQDNRYFSLDAKLPIEHTPVSLTGSVGIEDGAFAAAKRDWSLGVQADCERFAFGISYVDTARSGGDQNAAAGLVLSMSAAF